MAWDSDNLCVVSDIEKEIGDSSLLLQVQASERSAVIAESIKVSGERVSDDILSKLPDIYARSGPVIIFDTYIEQLGYTYEDLDGILDMILNPTVMKRTVVAGAIVALANRQIMQNTAGYQRNEALMTNERDYWEKQYKSRFDNGWRQLKLDLNGDEKSSDYERPRTHHSFMRV